MAYERRKIKQIYKEYNIMNIKDNKMIAEFMGMTYGDPNDNSVMTQGSEVIPIESMEFHSSWDWLMLVVDKIESMRDKDGNAYRFSIDMCNAEIENTNIQLLGEKYKIDAVYKVAVKFIRAVHTLKIKN